VIIHKFADEVNQSDLNVTIEVFDNSLLGSEDQMFQGMVAGAVDMAKISPAQAASIVPAFDAFSLPYIFEDSEQMFKVIEGPIGKQLADELEEKAGVKILAWMDQGSRNIYTVNTPVRTPEDLKGLKIRTINSPVMVATINAFGAAATPLSFGELYTAFKQRVVDGAENAPDAIYYAKHYEVAHYLSLTQHFRMPVLFCISMKAYNKLTAEQQKLIVDMAIKVAEENKDLYQDESDRLLQEMADNGLNVIEDVDIEAFKQLTGPVYAEFEGTIGKDIIDAMRATD
jgi:tripartite ATP-independent transporter DctP family solute receptor